MTPCDNAQLEPNVCCCFVFSGKSLVLITLLHIKKITVPPLKPKMLMSIVCRVLNCLFVSE